MAEKTKIQLKLTLVFTGTQEKFNSEKSCQTKDHFPLVQKCLENMLEVILTQ